MRVQHLLLSHLGSMGGRVKVPLGWVRVGHARGVAAHNVEVGPAHHARLGVPLDLRRACRGNYLIEAKATFKKCLIIHGIVFINSLLCFLF